MKERNDVIRHRFNELREDLEAKGYGFHTSCDTAVCPAV